MTIRTLIPSEVKRQLRQEAGFGCCNCGHPFIEYHHIVPVAAEAHNRPEDMMVTCGNCHRLFTNGAMSEREQRAMKARPRNIAENLAQGRLYVKTTELRVELAGGIAIDTPNLLNFRGTTILGARLSDEGRVLLSAVVQDAEGNVIATLTDNEWNATPSLVWDFECAPLNATVRLAPRQIAFAADCRDDRVKLRGEWFLGGMRAVFTPTECRIGRNVLTGSRVVRCGGFIGIR